MRWHPLSPARVEPGDTQVEADKGETRMNTPPANAGGVAPPDGYTTDTGQMSGAGRNIGNAAEDAKAEVEDTQPTELTDAEFGKEHTKWQADYAAAIEQLGQGATAMCDNLTAFAGQIGGAGAQYSSTESGATSTVTAPGSGL
jgi:hypothetical protein